MTLPTWLEMGFEIEPRGQTPAWFKQVHGAQVVCLDGQKLSQSPPLADAGYTRDRGKELHVFTADCVPVLIYAESADAPIAAIHAGWRGALAGVVGETLLAMDYPRGKMHAVLGPSMGVCCFEVKQDFVDTFRQHGDPFRYIERRDRRMFFDLKKFLCVEELKGVSIDTSHSRCTVCSLPLLPSYRRNGKADPMIRSFIRATNA